MVFDFNNNEIVPTGTDQAELEFTTEDATGPEADIAKPKYASADTQYYQIPIIMNNDNPVEFSIYQKPSQSKSPNP